VVGYVFAWLTARVAARGAERAGEAVDARVDAGLDRIGGPVAGRLGGDPALERAGEEAERGMEEPSERTRRRLVDSLEDLLERDPAFADELLQALEVLGPGGGGVTASDGGQAIGGNATIRAAHGSAVALRMGDVHLGGGAGNPSGPGPRAS
ncbi:hypothetical protein, partial [Streptomyces alkaliphilus]|uniref:hypothetical protein n=1 Tax=Streptomyces alkaliphilus TaxID=1472722 RepID=UPI0015FAD8E6